MFFLNVESYFDYLKRRPHYSSQMSDNKFIDALNKEVYL